MTNANNVTSNISVEQAQGKLTFDDKVIQKIVGIAVDNVDGLLTVDGGVFSNFANKLVNTNDVTAGINTDVGEKQVAVDMQIVAEYGKNIHDIYDEMKRVVGGQIKSMTGLDLVEMNVEVVDIKSAEEFAKDSKSLQDQVSETADNAKKNSEKKKEEQKQAEANQKPRVQ